MKYIMLLLGILYTTKTLDAASLGLKIVNETNANIADFPFVVSLQSSSLMGHFCGGSILNERYILTAAHCFDKPLEKIVVKYGATKWAENSRHYRHVNTIILHENYSNVTMFNDLAVLELDYPIEMGPLAQPVKLPPDESLPFVGTQLTSLGWGYIHEDAMIRMEVLQKVQLPLYSDYECEKTYKESSEPTKSLFHICAGMPEGKIGFCSGDSGGPLVFNGVQYGIVSYGDGCAGVHRPGVYTRVPFYLDWIKSRIYSI